MQVKLFRVLQEGKVRPVGSNEEYEIDVRVIAATNKDLDKAIAAGEFREDLYYRLSVIPIQLPPLRERREDIPLLARSFLERFRKTMEKPIEGIAPEAMSLLEAYDWPGNVRELENTMERSVALETGKHDFGERPSRKNSAPRDRTKVQRTPHPQTAMSTFRRAGSTWKNTFRTWRGPTSWRRSKPATAWERAPRNCSR